jgi:hypothetical protein
MSSEQMGTVVQSPGTAPNHITDGGFILTDHAVPWIVVGAIVALYLVLRSRGGAICEVEETEVE